MTGCEGGRRFTANNRRTAAAFVASAPSPYTVSVGNATNPPARSTSAARATSGVTSS
jgi:hypothetical protein